MQTKKQKLNEAVQLLEARNRYLEQQLKSTSEYSVSKLNPLIINCKGYETALRAADRIQASSRYIIDIPELGIPSNRLMCLMYDYGSLCFFRDQGKLMVTTYAKGGSLNPLGDLTTVYPIDFAGNKYTEEFTVVYDNNLHDRPCVIINDYTGTYLENQIIPRASINSVSIKDQAAVYRKMSNAVKLTAKKAIALIDSATQKAVAEKMVNDMFNDDNPVLAIVAENLNQLVKMFNLDTKLDIEGYLRAIETYEKMRANFNGIVTRSPVEKKERLITAEAESSSVLTQLYLEDGLMNWKIGIELMKKHAIIKEGSAKINPVLICKDDYQGSQGEQDER